MLNKDDFKKTFGASFGLKTVITHGLVLFFKKSFFEG